MLMYVSQSGAMLGLTHISTFTWHTHAQNKVKLTSVGYRVKTKLASISKMVCESSPTLDNKIYNLKLINKLPPEVGGFWTSC